VKATLGAILLEQVSWTRVVWTLVACAGGALVTVSRRNRMPRWTGVSLVLAVMVTGTLSLSKMVDAEETEYLRDVKPLLARKCYGCHGAIRQEAELRLDTVQWMQHGGDSGPAINREDVGASLLLERVTAEEYAGRMPPEGEPLTEKQVSLLRQWLDSGAKAPADEAPQADPLTHWAFQPLRAENAPPQVRDAKHPVDAFIRKNLTELGISPAPQASALTLIRRMFLDLHGLPPTLDELDDWSRKLELCEPSADDADGLRLNERAVQELIDYLLASPRYGERHAQSWLDMIRYADTHGFEVNTPRPHAWPYRDYVIQAMNEDKPYDQFIVEQLAGDTIGRPAATGFLVAAAVLLPGQIGKDDESIRLARQDALDEIIVGTSGSFLGLTVGCARCHDHKFDPISQADYYGMQAFFAGVEYGDREIRDIGGKSESQEAANSEESRLVFAGVFRSPDETYVLSRGNPEQRLERIGPRIPESLGNVELAIGSDEHARRVALAQWIASPENPLTSRVMVNRIWQSHFGTGLVETPSDFGLNGATPSHPELLDWLAAEFIRCNWSVKQLRRLILTSHTYQQSSRIDEAARIHDSDGRLLWRYPSRRLEAEAIRDSVLQVTGRLNLTMGGPGFDFFTSRGGLSGFPPLDTFGENELRRMIYSHKVRMESVPVFGAFDCPDAGQATPTRSRSTTAIQALNLFNSPFMNDQAVVLAERIIAEIGSDPNRQMEFSFRQTLGRAPSATESSQALQIVEEHGLSTLCRVLLNSNEFLFLP
jgi:hypothetical protein